MSARPARPSVESLEARDLPSAAALPDLRADLPGYVARLVQQAQEVVVDYGRALAATVQGAVQNAVRQIPNVDMEYQGGLVLNQDPHFTTIVTAQGVTPTSLRQAGLGQALFAAEPYFEQMAPYYKGVGKFTYDAAAAGPLVDGGAEDVSDADIQNYLESNYDDGAYRLPYAPHDPNAGNRVLVLILNPGQVVSDYPNALGYHSSFYDAKQGAWVYYCVVRDIGDVAGDQQILLHEAAEAMTDPQVGQYQTLGRSALGFINVIANNEIADVDEWNDQIVDDWYAPTYPVTVPRLVTPDGHLLLWPGHEGDQPPTPTPVPNPAPTPAPTTPPGPVTVSRLEDDLFRIAGDAAQLVQSRDLASLDRLFADVQTWETDVFLFAVIGYRA